MTEATKVPSTAAKPQRTSSRNSKGKRPFKKKGSRKPIPAIKRGDPVFLYHSECHGARAEKSPCERTPEDKVENQFSQSSLGKWKCTECRRSCKVTRSKNKPVTKEPASPAIPE